jgi:hypothetical protein
MAKTPRCVRFLKLKLLAARASAKYMDRSKGQYSDKLIKSVQAELHEAEIRERASKPKLKKPGLESFLSPPTFRTGIKTEESRIVKVKTESRIKIEKDSRVKIEKDSRVKIEKDSTPIVKKEF